MRQQRFLSWLLTLCLLLGMFSFPAYAEGNTTTTTISGDGTAEKTGTMTVTLVIPKKTPAATDLTYTAPSDLTYSSSDKAATVSAASGVTGLGEITVKYYSDAARTTEAAPKNVGTYYVGATVAEGDQYAASASVLYDNSWTFTITASTPSAPAAPTMASATKNSITLNAVSGCEYSKDGATYQDSTEFTGLMPGTEYTFYQRVKATANTNASAASSASFTTEADTYAMTITLVIKPAQTITASDVTATYGDTGKSVSGTTSGDGAISYSVKSGDAVTVNPTTGALTIVKAGSAVITVTAAETATYAQATKDVNVTVNTKAMTVSAENVNVTVDGQPHGITVNVTDPASGATVKYGTEEGSYTLDASPTQTEVGEKTVYYQVTADNYTTYTGSAKVTVNAKQTQTITASDVTATYGDTDKSVSGTTTGDGAISYSVKSGDAVTVDSTTGALTILKAGSAVITVTAAETATYAQATKDVNVTVNTKAMTVSAENVNVTVDGQPHGITVNVTDPASGATVKYGTEEGSYTLDASPTQTEAGELTVYYQVTADNYTTYTGSAKVTVSDKSTQTIDASDVTATYGDTDKKVEATTDGNGAISYAVKEGSSDYIDVDSTTGALTIKKVGTATVIVTAAETATYAQATKEVTVTINKANAVAASVTANNRTYDGTEKPLVTVTGEPTGGEMQYALGTAGGATQPYTTSIPSKTDAGTYYVWYKAVSDEDHSDSKPACITVTISKPAVAPAPADEEKGEANFKPSAAAPDVKGVEQEAIKTQMEELAKADDTKLKAGQVKEATVNMETKAVAESDVPKKEASAIKETAEGMIPAKDRESTKCDFLDIAVSKIVIVYDVKNGQKVKNESDSISAGLTNLAQVIDIPVKYDLTGKFNPLIVRYHNGKAEAFRRLYAAPAKDALKDGTYYVEGTGKNAIVHIYTNRFSTYALLTSGTEEYPKLGDSVTVYRLYYGPTMEHFYTTSAYERRVLIDKYGWVDEGIAWKSPKAPTTDEEKKTIKPVYRLFNPFTTDHHYTKDANERKTLIEKYGWKDEGVAFYSNEKGDATVYRLWHPGLITGAHHFTTGKHEYDVLITRGWIGETEAFKVNAAS